MACDRDERSLDVARRYFARAGVLPKVRSCRMSTFWEGLKECWNGILFF